MVVRQHHPRADSHHRRHPGRAGHSQRVRDLHHDQRTPAPTEHRPGLHRTAGVHGRPDLHHTVGRRRRRVHRVRRRGRTAGGAAALRAGDHRSGRRRHPGIEWSDRPRTGGSTRPDQCATGRLHRTDRNRPDQQPGGQPGRFVIPVGGLGPDAGEDPARCATPVRIDIRPGGRRDDSLDQDSGTGDHHRHRHTGIRCIRPSVAGATDQAPGEPRTGCRGLGDRPDDRLGRHGIGHLHRGQSGRQEHRGRLATDGDQPGHHRPAGPGRRDAVADPSRRRGRPQALVLPACRRDAPGTRRLSGPQGLGGQERTGPGGSAAGEMAAGRRTDQRLHHGG